MRRAQRNSLFCAKRLPRGQRDGGSDRVERFHGSQFSMLNAQFSVPGSQFSVPGSQFLVLSSRFSVPGSQFSVLSSWFSVLGSQFPVLSSWFLVLGSWFPVPGSQFSTTARQTHRCDAGNTSSQSPGSPGRSTAHAARYRARGGSASESDQRRQRCHTEFRGKTQPATPSG
jgi:hypothetical protein